MSAPDLTTARACVLQAIKQIRESGQRWKQVEADPKSTGFDRHRARQDKENAMRDFSIQWENVERLLAAQVVNIDVEEIKASLDRQGESIQRAMGSLNSALGIVAELMTITGPMTEPEDL